MAERIEKKMDIAGQRCTSAWGQNYRTPSSHDQNDLLDFMNPIRKF